MPIHDIRFVSYVYTHIQILRMKLKRRFGEHYLVNVIIPTPVSNNLKTSKTYEGKSLSLFLRKLGVRTSDKVISLALFLVINRIWYTNTSLLCFKLTRKIQHTA